MSPFHSDILIALELGFSTVLRLLGLSTRLGAIDVDEVSIVLLFRYVITVSISSRICEGSSGIGGRWHSSRLIVSSCDQVSIWEI